MLSRLRPGEIAPIGGGGGAETSFVGLQKTVGWRPSSMSRPRPTYSGRSRQSAYGKTWLSIAVGAVIVTAHRYVEPFDEHCWRVNRAGDRVAQQGTRRAGRRFSARV